MKNTGITYTSAERSPVILPEMAELLPPLSAEQSAALEEDLLRNGCYSPIIVNEDMVIVDGHMSYAQAAEVTGKTVKQITNMVYRGKESLRKLLEREGITNAES